MATCTILGVEIDCIELSDVLKSVDNFIKSKSPHQIVTVNTEYVMAAQGKPEFLKAINNADLALADGAGIVQAAKLMHQLIPTRITGVDLVQLLAHQSADSGYKLFLLGGGEGVAAKTAEILKNKYHNLNIVGTHAGSPSEVDLVKRIIDAKPDILLVAWGAPKQDIWIAKHKHDLNVPVMIGVGGTFDFIIGKQKRAPKWMREHGLEWLWRLVREPSRLRRQLALPQMFLTLYWQKLTRK